MKRCWDEVDEVDCVDVVTAALVVSNARVVACEWVGGEYTGAYRWCDLGRVLRTAWGAVILAGCALSWE